MVSGAAPRDNLLEAALAWEQAGCAVIPIRTDGSKAPAVTWKPYIKERPDAAQIRRWWTSNPDYGIAIITGFVSDNLEMLELEGRARDDEHLSKLNTVLEFHELGQLWHDIQAGYSEDTPSGGMHVLYRVAGGPGVPGNTKLAIQEDNLCLSETRGEGGYVIVAPTPGWCHPAGKPWSMIIGGPESIVNVASWDRDRLVGAFRAALHEKQPPPPRESKPIAPHDPLDGERPGDAFMRQTDWYDILDPAGWRIDYQHGSEIFWTRPGKDTGISATTGRRDGEQDCLYVFSSSTDLPTEEPLTKLYVYAHYNYSGNLSAAGKALYEQGFGERREHDYSNDEFAASHGSGEHPQRLAAQATQAPRTFDAAGNPVSTLRLTPASLFAVKRVRWLWKDRCPIGEMTLIPGREGVGKSLLLASLASSITRGGLPGEFDGEPRAVMYCASEDSWNYTIAPRLIAAGANMDLVFRLDVNPESGLLPGSPVLPRDIEDLKLVARSVHAAALMLDPVISMLGKDIDSHKASDLRGALEPLRRAAEVVDMGILALVHFNKSSGTDTSSKVAGSRAWTEVARAVISIARLPQEEDETEDSDTMLTGARHNRVVLSQEKSNLGKLDLPNLMYEIHEVDIPAENDEVASVGKVVWCGESPMSASEAIDAFGRRPKGENMTAIVEWCREEYSKSHTMMPMASFNQVFTVYPFEMTPDNVRQTVGRAVKHGLIEKAKHGMYLPATKANNPSEGVPR
jgi:hypothetical protein